MPYCFLIGFVRILSVSRVKNIFIPDKSRLYEIRHQANALRMSSGVAGIVMLPLNTIAEFLQFRIHLFQPQEDNQNVAGAIDYPRRIIFINALDGMNRQRFSIAHEFGHMLIHTEYQDEPGWVYDFRSPDPTHKKQLREQEADLFAAELLMPVELVKQQVMLFAGNLSSVANEFQVSMESLRYRLDFLNHEIFNTKRDILDRLSSTNV